MDIDLVYPGSCSGSDNYSSEPPLGPIALYSSLTAECRARVRFLDSTLLSHTEIEKSLAERKALVVALSCTTFNYSNALRLAELAKRHGAYVVAGGIHITYLRNVILDKMERGERAFDYLVTGYGEPAFAPLLGAIERGLPCAQIPNVAFVRDGKRVISSAPEIRRNRDPLGCQLDYGAVSYATYSDRFQRSGNLANVHIVGSTFTQRGCAYSRSRKCAFCSIEQISCRRPVKCVEDDIVSLVTKQNADHIRINDGDFTTSVHHMASVADAIGAATKRTGMRPTFFCFARADEIDETRIQILKSMNVVSVFIGYESGSNAMLRRMQKGTTREQNIEATSLLKKHGIDVICAGLVLGAEGESEKTLSETLDFVNALKAIDNTRSLLATPLIPLPGSPSFLQLKQVLSRINETELPRCLTSDVPDIRELLEVWIRTMCNVPLRRIIEVCDEIAQLFQVGIRFVTVK